jgi:hypothetical protein
MPYSFSVSGLFLIDNLFYGNSSYLSQLHEAVFGQ